MPAPVMNEATRSACGQYAGAPRCAPGPRGLGQFCTDPPGRPFATVVGTAWAIGSSAAVGSTVHVPETLEMVVKPFCVRNPPDEGDLNSARTPALGVLYSATIAFSL